MQCAAFDLGLVEAVGVCNYKTSQLQQFHSLMLARDIPIASNQVPMLQFLLHWWDSSVCFELPGAILILSSRCDMLR